MIPASKRAAFVAAQNKTYGAASQDKTEASFREKRFAA